MTKASRTKKNISEVIPLEDMYINTYSASIPIISNSNDPTARNAEIRAGFTGAGSCIEKMKEGLETKHKNTLFGLQGHSFSG